MSSEIVVLDYGMGNIHSIIKALRLYHDNVLFTDAPEKIKNCRALVLPGDGAFPAAMDHLAGEKQSLIVEHVDAGKPVLGICIGFQILFEDSTEVIGQEQSVKITGQLSDQNLTEKNCPGLNLLTGKIRKFSFEDTRERIPHMGWNILQSAETKNYWNQYMYFIHSYHAEDVPIENIVAEAEYGAIRFPAAVRKDNILATQFHPEKSDRAGLALLEDWVQSVC